MNKLNVGNAFNKHADVGAPIRNKIVAAISDKVTKAFMQGAEVSWYRNASDCKRGNK